MPIIAAHAIKILPVMYNLLYVHTMYTQHAKHGSTSRLLRLS